MKKYVNGYDKPSFQIYNPSTNTTTVITLSSRYQSLKEYYEKVSAYTKLLNGAKDKQFLHYDMEWHLDYSQMIESSDLLKIRQIESAEDAGLQITLMPHSDFPYRKFRVFILDEKREIALDPHFNGAPSLTNKGFSITFVNALPVYDPMFLPGDYLPHTPFHLHNRLCII